MNAYLAPMVRLDEVLSQRKEFIRIEDLESYKRCRVQLHAQGVVLRDVVLGSQVRTKNQQVCRAGEFLVAEIDAKVGGYGLVPDDLDGAIVSSHCFLFEIDHTRLLPRFLEFFTRTRAFGDQVTAQGSTNYAAVRPAQVLSYQLPLPSLEEQRSLVQRIDSLLQGVEKAIRLRRSSMAGVEAFREGYRDKELSSNGTAVELGSVVTVIDPNPSHRYPAYVPAGVAMISTSDFVGDDGIDTSRAKHVSGDFYHETLGRFGVGPGDVIFARKGKIGYARLYPTSVSELAMTHTLCVLQPDRTSVMPEYLLEYARSGSFLRYLGSTMNPNLGVPTLGLDVIRKAPFQLRSIEEQSATLSRLSAMRGQLERLATIQSSGLVDLESVVPSAPEEVFGHARGGRTRIGPGSRDPWRDGGANRLVRPLRAESTTSAGG